MLSFDKLIKKYKSSESLFSLILGIAVVLVVGNQVIGFLTKKSAETSDPNKVEVDIPADDQQVKSEYVVKKGDYLYLIAQNILGDGNQWPLIAQYNKITHPDFIIEGDKLQIPAKQEVKGYASGSTVDTTLIVAPTITINDSQNTISTTTSYIVMANDSLWTICIRAYGDGYLWPKVAKTNNLRNPDLLEKGQILSLPR